MEKPAKALDSINSGCIGCFFNNANDGAISLRITTNMTRVSFRNVVTGGAESNLVFYFTDNIGSFNRFFFRQFQNMKGQPIG